MQRVRNASVAVNNEVCGAIDGGFMVLLGVKTGDTVTDAEYIAAKIAGLRVFDDENGIMNLPITQTGGAVLLVSQFTLYGDARKGRRPAYSSAAKGEEAELLYKKVKELIQSNGITVQTGVFGADMAVSLLNDGPVTILLDSEKNF